MPDQKATDGDTFGIELQVSHLRMHFAQGCKSDRGIIAGGGIFQAISGMGVFKVGQENVHQAAEFFECGEVLVSVAVPNYRDLQTTVPRHFQDIDQLRGVMSR